MFQYLSLQGFFKRQQPSKPLHPMAGQLHSLIQNHEPDDFTIACRNALLGITAQMPLDQARLIYDHVTQPCPWTTEREHQAWLNSYQCQAMRLEIMMKSDQSSLYTKHE